MAPSETAAPSACASSSACATDQRCRDHAERSREGDVSPGRARVAQQARVERPHRSVDEGALRAGSLSNVRPVWSGIRSAEIRLRNTQYVQPW